MTHYSSEHYNVAAIRKLLRASFSDEELTSMCYDHFRSAHNRFGSGMGKEQKIQALIEQAETEDILPRLLYEVNRRKPNQYEKYRKDIHLDEGWAGDLTQVESVMTKPAEPIDQRVEAGNTGGNIIQAGRDVKMGGDGWLITALTAAGVAVAVVACLVALGAWFYPDIRQFITVNPTNTPTPPGIIAQATPTDTPTSAPPPTDTPVPAPPPVEEPEKTEEPALPVEEEPAPPVEEPVKEEPAPPVEEPMEEEEPAPPAASLSGKIAVTLDKDGYFQVVVVKTTGELVGTVGRARQPDFNAGGNRLVVNGTRGDYVGLFCADPTGAPHGQLLDSAEAEHPVWSANGGRLLYDDLVPGRGDDARKLYTVSTDGGTPQEVTAKVGLGQIFGAYPLWKPNGDFVFRACADWLGDASKCGVWSMGVEGDPQRLVEGLVYPTDANNKHLVYMSNSTGDWEVYLLDMQSGAETRLTDSTGLDGQGCLSPDGGYAAYLSKRGGVWAVWAYPIGGGDEQKLFDVNPGWGSVREDEWTEERLSWGQ